MCLYCELNWFCWSLGIFVLIYISQRVNWFEFYYIKYTCMHNCVYGFGKTAGYFIEWVTMNWFPYWICFYRIDNYGVFDNIYPHNMLAVNVLFSLAFQSFPIEKFIVSLSFFRSNHWKYIGYPMKYWVYRSIDVMSCYQVKFK